MFIYLISTLPVNQTMSIFVKFDESTVFDTLFENKQWIFDRTFSECQYYTKVFAEKLGNGKTIENDRRNDLNWLILVLKDTWHYEKDWDNAHIFV